MGVDATLFARRARRGIYIDRLWPWRPEDNVGDVIFDKLRGYCRGDGRAASSELILLCNTLIAEEAAENPGASRDLARKWLWDLCIKFAQEHPDDEFFISSDHDSVDWWEVRDSGNYTVWDPFDTDGKQYLPPWSPDYKPSPPRPGPTYTPEQREQMRKNVEELARALERGAAAPPTAGGPLKLEPLDKVLRELAESGVRIIVVGPQPEKKEPASQS